MPNIFQQFMGKARTTEQAPTTGGTIGNYLSQVQDVGDMVTQQQGQLQSLANEKGSEAYDAVARYRVDPTTGEMKKLPPRAYRIPSKPPGLDISPKTPKHPRQTFGQLNKKAVAPAEFRKNTMAGYVTDALKAQIIAKILESNQ